MKKKFKEEELNELKKVLLKGWIAKIGTEEGFHETWQVVEDAARYSFNASHALSVAIDSLYGAYLKSHYPLEYFTVALTIYSNDMERTAKLIEELKYFEIKLNNIKFGKSGNGYTMDKKTNSIYKSIASIKFCNAQIADELYELSKNHYNNFVELLQDINTKTSINTRQLDILAGLNFFSDFGQNKYILNIIELCNGVKADKKKGIKAKPALLTVKQIKKDKLEELGLTEYLMKKYAAKETAKQYSQIDNVGLINELITRLDNKPLDVISQVKFEMEYLEYCVYTNPKVSEKYYIVTDFKTFKNPTTPYLVLHNIKTGEDVKTRIKQGKIFKDQPFGEYSILKISQFTKSNKKKCINGVWQYVDEFEDILEEYEVIK